VRFLARHLLDKLGREGNNKITMNVFTPKALPKDEVEKLFTGWLLQAETKSLEAWVNYNLRPGDSVLKAVWEQAQENVAWLATEKQRCLEATR
jgi:hypothetical protein